MSNTVYVYSYITKNALRLYYFTNIGNNTKIDDENKLYKKIFQLNTNEFLDTQLFSYDNNELVILGEDGLNCESQQFKELLLARQGYATLIRPVYFKLLENSILFTNNSIITEMLSQVFIQPLQLCNNDQLKQLRHISKIIVKSGQFLNFSLDPTRYKFAILYNYVVIGFIEVDPILQCFIIPEYRKCNIATFIIGEIMEFANKDLISHILPSNIGAIKLLNKLDFTQEKKHKKINGIEYYVFTKVISKKYEIVPIDSKDAFMSIDTIDSKDDFPYRKYYMPKFIDMYSTLKTLYGDIKNTYISEDMIELIGNHRKYIYTIDRTFPDDYELADSIVDHFAEPVRIQCAERKEKSPYQIWEENKAEYLSKCPINDMKALREMVYYGARGCNVFNVALGIHLFSYFKATSLLDCTAGWGDRLIAASISGVKFYRGWDTNVKLQKVYNNIYHEISKIENTIENELLFQMDWKIFCAPFEKSNLFHKDEYDGQNYYQKFDVAFLSPPFYDKELYEGDNTSTTSYKDINDWYKYFYKPMFKRASLAVRCGGHILGYIPDGRMRKEAHSVLSENGFIYIGIVAFRTIVSGKDPQVRDTFVWRKQNYSPKIESSHSPKIESSHSTKINILPHKQISSVKFKLGQKFDTNNIDLGVISTKEKFNKLLQDHPDLQITELPQNIKKQIEINIVVYNIIINGIQIIKYYLLNDIETLNSAIIKKINILLSYMNNYDFKDKKITLFECTFTIDMDDIVWITSIYEKFDYMCNDKIILNEQYPYLIFSSLKFEHDLHLTSHSSSTKKMTNFIIYKSAKNIGAINIEFNSYGNEISILLKTKYQKKEILYSIFIIISEYTKLHLNEELTYIEIDTDNEKYNNICKKLGFKNITAFGHISSIVYKIL